MKKLLLLSTLSALAIVATAQARHAADVEVDINVNGEAAVREDIKVETSHVRSEGRPCTWTQGPTFRTEDQVIPGKTFQCPSCPICPKVQCKAELVEECSTCMKAPRAHHGCKGGSCKRGHRSREVVETVVAE